MYATRDIALAAALITNGVELKDVEMLNERIAEFIFEEHPSIDDWVQDFWKRRLKVDAMTYQDNVRFLKSRILK